MNKFVLGIFVILAIGMADLPSTLACSPDILHQLTTITTQSPSNVNPPEPAPNPGVVYSRPVVASAPAGPIVHGIPQPAHPSTIDSIVDAISVPEQPRSIDAGSNVFELEMEGFSICNTDGTEGLTFNEIIACQIRLGDLVMYPWPTASDFDAADDNKDGNLTKAEFVQYIS